MIIIGLCGSSGSGKGYVCKKLNELYSFEHIDTDKVYRDIVVSGSPCLDELCSHFGSDILSIDGSLNRRVLSAKVFEGEGADKRLQLLNSVTHKYIRAETERIIAENRSNGAWATLIDAPVLFESEFDKLCDCTVCVTAPTELKLKRIIKRDGITPEKAEARLRSQLSDEKLRALCDFEIVNNDSGDLEARIDGFICELKTKFGN